MALAAALALASLLLARQPGELSVQSWKNIHFARKPSFGAAFLGYPLVRPPFYPILLWSFARIGVTPGQVNGLLQAALILGLALFFRRHLT